MPVQKNTKNSIKHRTLIDRHFHKPDFKPEDMRPLEEWVDNIPKRSNLVDKFPSREGTRENIERLMQHYRMQKKLELIRSGHGKPVRIRRVNPLFDRIKLDKGDKPPSMMDEQFHPNMKFLKIR